METCYRFGFDIGIGSIGWSVIRVEKDGGKSYSCIENLGTRVFDSGENSGKKVRKSQIRREERGVRRIERRCKHRKDRIKSYFEKCGYLTQQMMNEANEILKSSPLKLKVEGLDRELSFLELYLCIIHTCNHRGYRDFYENDDYELEVGAESERQKEEAVNKRATQELSESFRISGHKIISAYFMEKLESDHIDNRGIRNKQGKELRQLVTRELMNEELTTLLECQKKYHPELQTELISDIVFSQRCFEDGPGDPQDDHRQYKGFIESLGYCPFYKTEKRGFRSTLLGDLFALVNALSQRKYINQSTGELKLPKELASNMLKTFINDGGINEKTIKTLAAEYDTIVQAADKDNKEALSKINKVTRHFHNIYSKNNLDWSAITLGNILERNTELQQIENVLCKYITPRIRKGYLKEIKMLNSNKNLLKEFADLRVSGTSGVSYKFMIDSIKAFLNGEAYGNFQYRWTNEVDNVEEDGKKERYTFLSADLLTKEEDIVDNPVVMRAINETRKLINALIRVYGSPYSISLEVASELSHSFLERDKINKQQATNEKKRDEDRLKISELLSISQERVTSRMLEMYRLYEEQEGKSLYSGKNLGEITDVLLNRNDLYEIDHIVPYSLILDNTLHNKALVFSSENQEKGQRTPLMYLSGEKQDTFIKKVNVLAKCKNSVISAKKYKYLMLDTLDSREAKELLADWKSRNINDTRYISRFLVSFIQRYLKFQEPKARVWAVKGALTAKFRRLWLNKKTWGGEFKNRDTNLNHAVDATVIACLDNLYIAISDEAFKIRRLAKYYKSQGYDAPEVQTYITRIAKMMYMYYGANVDMVKRLLVKSERIPCLINSLAEEIDLRCIDDNYELFMSKCINYYGDKIERFKVPIHMPLTSRKAEKKYSGEFTDSNPIKIREFGEGKKYKLKRKDISQITKGELPQIVTDDSSLMAQLEDIFEGKDGKYTIEKYLKENSLPYFKTISGHPIYKLSIREKNQISNFYTKTYGKHSSTLGGLGYYCVEVYKTKTGKLSTWGVAYLQLQKENKKLVLKDKNILPSDYKEHMMYLFSGDYIEVYDRNYKLKFGGYYQSVKSINRGQFHGFENNQSKSDYFSITASDRVKKYAVDLLGNIGGEVKCSVPLSFSKENF